MINKIYKCYLCNKEVDKPFCRLVKQKYGKPVFTEMGTVVYRKQMYNILNYDFCENCYKKFEKWINENKE